MKDRIRVINGDCLIVMKEMIERGEQFSSVVCDPPYHLASIVKRFSKEPTEKKAKAKSHMGSAAEKQPPNRGAQYKRLSRGFMGKEWDGGDVAFNPETWKLAFDLLKPGAHLAAFSATRNYHRMAVAIEDAGFEIRDQLAWVYATGFPKSHKVGCKCKNKPVPYNHDIQKSKMLNVQKDILKAEVLDQESEKTLLQLQMQRNSAGEDLGDIRSLGSKGEDERELRESRAKDGKESSLEGRDHVQKTQGKLQRGNSSPLSESILSNGEEERLHSGTPISNGKKIKTPIKKKRGCASFGSQPAQQQSEEPNVVQEQRRTQENGRNLCPACGGVIGYESWGTAIKPAWEPIVLARKPIEGTVAGNVLKHGTGALNVDACRIGDSGGTKDTPTGQGNKKNEVFGKYGAAKTEAIDGLGRFPANILHDGSAEVAGYFPQGASKFFYSAKADKAEKIDRDDSHPTVKPVELMSWLCRLITPPGGAILDPFGGTGSTGIGGALEGFNVTLIEREKAYYQDILKRIEKTTGDDLPIFSGQPEQAALI